MKTMILVILTAAITNNYVLVKFLGICPFLGVSKKLDQATGMSLAAWLEQALWQPAGVAHDGVWHAYQQGKHDVGAHGFNATLEGWGRFGEFVARDGRLSNGKQLVPTGWFDQAASWTKALNSVSAAHPEGIYGYQ